MESEATVVNSMSATLRTRPTREVEVCMSGTMMSGLPVATWDVAGMN